MWVDLDENDDAKSIDTNEYDNGSEVETELGSDDEDNYNAGINKFTTLHDAKRT